MFLLESLNLFFSFLRKKVWVLSERRRRRETKEEVFCIGSNNNGDSVRIQTEEVEKKSLNFLLLSFCVHIRQGEGKTSGYWLRIVGVEILIHLFLL
ncbi:LOW QUALITY PROTEIN: uncharacterized protein LOC108870942 [Brassica rapa]|uniref:LOW QUALITY PROTEIN: uncharacterized protein LOC108870942 n=1 Tax=Brassica campestris TaxID=3711 RepID=UPI000871DFEE|nr:LOW QUALITY PROTEIN: uncharacterized protein LOC108870942 [Brassica rapa]